MQTIVTPRTTHEIVLELETHGAIEGWSIGVDGKDASVGGWERGRRGWTKLIPLSTTERGLKVTIRCSGDDGAWCRLAVTLDGVPQFPPLRAFVKGGVGMRSRWFPMRPVEPDPEQNGGFEL